MSKLYDLLSAMCGKIKKPDWNQNDPTAADYVKNRPFYETDEGEVVKIDPKYLPESSGGANYLDLYDELLKVGFALGDPDEDMYWFDYLDEEGEYIEKIAFDEAVFECLKTACNSTISYFSGCLTVMQSYDTNIVGYFVRLNDSGDVVTYEKYVVEINTNEDGFLTLYSIKTTKGLLENLA